MSKEDSPVKFYLASQDKPAQASALAVDSALQAKLDDLQSRYDELQETYERAGVAATRAADQANDLQDKLMEANSALDKVKSEYADYVQASDKTGQQYQQERDDLLSQVNSLTQERDAAQKALADGKLLPAKDEAIRLISTVKRVSDEMAGEIYDVLVNPPATS